MSTNGFHEPHYGIKIAGAIVVGMPIAGLGVLCCITVILSPVGLALILLSGMPLGHLLRTHEKRKQAWIESDRPLPVEMTPPWLTEIEDY